VTDETSVYDIIPDWSQFSFDDFGAIGSSGSVPNLGRSWKAGQSVADVLKLEDLAGSLSPQDFSLSQIGQLSNVDLTQISASSFPLIAKQKVSALVEAVPRLGEFSLNEVAPLKTLFLNQGLPEQALGTPLSELLSQFTDFGKSSFATLPKDQLSRINVAEIPNIDIPQLQAFEGFESQAIAQIPGLSQVPLASFPNPIATIGSIIARIDMVYGPAENNRHNTISGSNVVGFDARCPDDGMLTNPPDALVTPAKCAYIELDDLENQGKKMQSSFEGKQWISGKYHAVRGGHGALANMPGMNYLPGFEPTGRHPFGPFFKQVIWEPDESTDQVSSALFFRFCDPSAGCTPYNQFSVPFLTYPVNSLIFVGALNDFGGAAPSASFGSGGASAAAGSPAIARSNPPCIQGVGGSNLGEAIAAIESQGSGDYQAIGNPTCDKAGLCGVALGRYQTMSYKESVQAVVGKVPGGANWLAALNRGATPTPEEILRYYPQAAQEEVYKIEIADLTARATSETDPTTGQPFTGNRLIERVAQMWYGGPGIPTDSGRTDNNGVLTVYEYGVKAQQIYEGSSKGVKPVNCTTITATTQGDGKATGTFVNPAPGSVETSPFGERESGFHEGLDLAGALGDPILSADGGKVIFVGFEDGGYGNYLMVDHQNGTMTLYAHLDSIGVQEGQSVSAGQTLGAQGTTGGSTGVHLHFEVYTGTTPGDRFSGQVVDPRPFLNL
jgi:murein DD-endopeptidase MepM/ murein hydrolase activator NlpD